jgi:hypothetical protein
MNDHVNTRIDGNTKQVGQKVSIINKELLEKQQRSLDALWLLSSSASITLKQTGK